MIEIIALIFLTQKIGALAASKGLPAGRWKLYLVLGWILLEMIGVFIGVAIFGFDNLVSWMLVAIGFALAAFFIIRNYLTNLPDQFGDDIENIGRN